MDKEREILLHISTKKFHTLGQYYAELESLIKKGREDRKDERRWWRTLLMADDQLTIPKFRFILKRLNIWTGNDLALFQVHTQ